MTEILYFQPSITNASREIEELVYMHDIDYIDACIMFCEKNNMDRSEEHTSELQSH